MGPSPSEGRRRRPIVRVLKWLGVVCLGILFLLIVAVGALQTPVGRNFVKSRVVNLLASRQIDFNVDQLRYNLFDLSLDLRDITIKSARRESDPPFAVIEHVTADLSLHDLLRGRYVVESGKVEGARVQYLVDENGDNLPRPPSDPNAPGEELDYLIADLTVTDSEVHYDNRVQQVDATIAVESVTVRGNRATNRHAISISSRGGRVVAQGREVGIAQLSAEVDLGQDDVKIRRALLDAEGARVELSGTLAQFANPVVDARVQATADAARTAKVAGVEDPVEGRVTINATATGLASAPTVDARIEGRGLAFRTIDALSLDALLGYNGEARQVTARSIEASAPWGRVTANGHVSLERGGSRASVRASSVDLARLMRSLDLDQTVASRVDAAADLTWPALDYMAASGTADVALRPTLRHASRSNIPVGGRISARGNRERLVAQLNRVAAAGVTVNGQVAVIDRDRLAGKLRASIADVGRTAAAAEAFLGRPAGAMMSDRIAGALDATVVPGGTITRPTAAASVDATALTVEGAGTLALSSRLRYTPAAVAVETADVVWGDARAHAEGQVGLERGQPLDLRFDVNALTVPSLLALAGQNPQAAGGTIAVTGTATGTLEHPAAAVTVRGSDLVAQGEPLGTLDIEAGLTGRRLAMNRLRLDKPQPDGGDGQLTAVATYDLDTRAYTYDVQSSNLRLTNLMLPDGRKVTGDVALQGKGGGTVAAPAGSLRADLGNLLVANLALGDVHLDATAANQRADVDLSADRFGLRSKASIDIAPSYPATIDARIDNLDLQQLPVQLQTPLSGRLSASATSSLELTNPKLARVDARIDALDGSWNGQPFALQGPAILALANERITIDRLALTAQDSTVTVRGMLPTNIKAGEGELTIEAKANLETLARYAPADARITATGSVQLAGTVRGSLEFVDPDLRVTIDNAAVSTPQLAPGIANLNAQARIAEGVATLERLSANWSAATIQAAASVPLDLVPPMPVAIPRRGGPASFSAELLNLDLATLPGAPADLKGAVSATVKGEAARPDLAALNATLTFPELRVSIRDLDLAQQQPSTVRVSAGQATVERFNLAGSAGTLTASGTVGLTGERPMDVRLDGDFNTAVAASFTDAITTDGRATLQLAAAGTLSNPDLTGAVALNGVNVAVSEPKIAVENLNARLDLAGNRLDVTTLSGSVNGGTLSGSGGLSYRNGLFEDVNLQVNMQDFAFDSPLDLRSLSNANITVREQGDGLVVGGKVVIREAGLTGDINFDQGLLATLNQPRALELTEERNPMLERVNFDVQVVTATPIVVDNNLARAEVRTNVRVLGTPYETGLSGTLTVLEGGEILLNERRYQVNRGVITFLEERRIVPSFDLQLATEANNYSVTLAVSGEPGDTETTLTSDPSLPEPDIMALLVTGRTLDQMRGEEGDIAKEQVFSYLAGRVGSQLGRSLERATGLSEVRLEPNLIANETDPSARLTVAQDITGDLQLIFSTDLADSNDQVWVARYDITRRFQTNAVRQADSSYRVDFRHDVRFGGQPPPRREMRQRPRVAGVNVAPTPVFPEAELRDRLGFETGDTFDYFTARDRVEAIERELQKQGWLQSRVRLGREQDGNAIVLNLQVDPGPKVRIAYEGLQPPDDVDREVRRQWNRGVFDSQRAGDAVEALQEWLIGERYMTATVAHQIHDASGAREVVFSITPGTKFEKIELEYAGANAIPPGVLDDIVHDQNLERKVFSDPAVVTELLRRYYREEGYVSARIDEPTYDYQGSVARAVLQVHEGPRFTIRRVSVAGNTVFDEQQLLATLPTVAGDPFLPRAAEAALEQMRELYWRRAYNDVRSRYTLSLDRDAGVVDIAFALEEGQKSVIAELKVEGNRKTSDHLVGEQLEIEKGQPLDLTALGRSRRNLYNTGAFSMVDITRTPLATTGDPAPVSPPAPESPTSPTDVPAADGAAAEAVKPIEVDVRVREVQPIQLRYGASYDTERGIGGILDVSNHNTLGKARVLGFAGKYDSSVREGRIYLNQPSLRYWPVATTASLYYREERSPDTEAADPFNVDRRGVSFQQERQLANSYVWTYGYRWERARKFDPLSGLRGDWTTVSPLTSTFTRETRDDVLDATHGTFTSQALSFSPTWLGGDDAYIKYYGQYFHYWPLEQERRKRFSNEMLRPRLVFATGIRVGLASGFGGARLPETERFYAGGSTTLRGFEQNAVGPIGADGIPTGGEALFVINNEIRFPLVSIVDGVGFVDIGNVFDRLRDFDVTSLRQTGGVGIRLRTPWFLVRGDYGVVFDPRPGEKRSRFYFSIGQAF